MSSPEQTNSLPTIDLTSDYRTTTTTTIYPKTVEKNGLTYKVEVQARAFSTKERAWRIAKGLFLSFISIGIAPLFSKWVRQLFQAEREVTVLGDELPLSSQKADLVASPLIASHSQNPSPSLPVKKGPRGKDMTPYEIELGDTQWLNSLDHLLPYMFSLEKSHPNFVYTQSLHKLEKETDDLSVGRKGFQEKLISDICPHGEPSKNKTIFAYPIVVHNNHYTMVIVDRQKRTIEYFDSKSNYGGPTSNKIIDKFLSQMAEELSTQDNSSQVAYTYSRVIKESIQADTYQCGPWTLFYLENKLTNNKLLQENSLNDYHIDSTKAGEIIKKYRSSLKENLSKLTKTEAYLALLPKERRISPPPLSLL